MLVKTIKVKIIKNQKSTLIKTLPIYEVELVKAIFGEDAVWTIDTKTAPREVLSVEEEERRLVDSYVQKHIEQLHGANFSEKIRQAIESAKATIRKTASEE